MERARRNVTFMRMMNCIPYSSFVISDSKDCPICLQEFTPDCQVVQLKCNSRHIYHVECMKLYLENDEIPFMDKQCPLCRSRVSINEDPDRTMDRTLDRTLNKTLELKQKQIDEE